MTAVTKWFEVIIYVGNNEVFRGVVRSKEPRTAITNVLTNKYSGEVSTVEVAEVKLVRVERVFE